MKKLFENWRRHLEEGSFADPESEESQTTSPDEESSGEKWTQRYDERSELDKFFDTLESMVANATRPGGLQSVEEAVNAIRSIGEHAAKVKTQLDFDANRQGIDQGTYAEEPGGAPETEIGPPPPEEYEP
jgi:hypothetical protein